ncbi:MAG: hypothetical protein AAF253_12975, partial [Pseudomonadota bacterium]
MGHLYPLAADARGALAGSGHAARTRADAERLAGDQFAVEALETEWLTPEEAEVDAILACADRAAGDGFVQRYEDEAGKPVFAVTFWRTRQVAQGHKTKAPSAALPHGSAKATSPESDHTDDLYFRAGRTR